MLRAWPDEAGGANDANGETEGAGEAGGAEFDEYGVPGPRSSVPGDDWNAVDHLSVWDCYLGQVKMSKDIPSEFHQQWAEALTEVLDRVEAARADPNPVVLERALKWFFLLHQLFFRLNAGQRWGRRLEASMRRRFLLWHSGEFKELVVLWTRDRLMSDVRRGRPLDRTASVRLAVKLIEDGCLSKAMVHLGENGLGDLKIPEIKAQLERKHPQHRREWDAAGIAETPRLILLAGSERTALKNLARNAGVGADRFRAEYLLRLVRGEIDSVTKERILEAWAKFADCIVNNDFPEWFYLVWTTVVQFAPIKTAGPTPQEHEVRPVGCGDIRRRAIFRMVTATTKESLRQSCEPVQLGQGTSGGTQAFGNGLQLHMQLYPRHILVVWDIVNAFNEYERAAVIEYCRVTPEFSDLCRMFESEFKPRSHIFALENGKLVLLEYRSVQGGQQGATSACIGHNIVTLPHFKAVDEAVGPNGCARAIMDDLVVAGDSSLVWPALLRLEENLLRVCGLRKHLTKPAVFSPSGEYGEMPETGYRIGSNGGGESGRPVGYGVVAAGVPIGDETFKCNYVALKVREVCGVIETTQSLLRLLPKARDHAFQVDRLSLSHRLDYLTQVIPPDTAGVSELLRQVDEYRLTTLAQTIGIDPLAAEETLPDPFLTRDRSFLPVRERGLGLVRSEDLARAAFVGAMELTVPRFPDWINENGDLVPGLFPHLQIVTGSLFREREGRWMTLIDSGLPLGASFKAAWESMRVEAGPTGVFEPTAEDAPGRPVEADVLPAHAQKGTPRLQRLVTRARLRTRARDFQRRVEGLPPGDMRWVASKFADQRALFATLPQASTVFSKDEFPSAVALYMGLPDPVVLAAMAARGAGPHFLQDAKGLRPLDVYGNSLSMFMGAGHGRTTFHNDVQSEVAYLAKAVGFSVRETPVDLFLNAISPRSRANYLRTLRTQTRTRSDVFRGGVVPDLIATSTGQMYDVKTTGFKPECYLAGRSVVDEKASTVPPQYRRRAHAADVQYNGTQQGEEGPVEKLLATMPQVQCLSVGAFGEVNRSTSTFMDALAEVGSERPERFGCCHGKEQAKGVIAQFIGRRLGRTLLRGVVRARHVALTASSMREAGQLSPRAQSAGPISNEWDAGNRTWVPI